MPREIPGVFRIKRDGVFVNLTKFETLIIKNDIGYPGRIRRELRDYCFLILPLAFLLSSLPSSITELAIADEVVYRISVG